LDVLLLICFFFLFVLVFDRCDGKIFHLGIVPTAAEGLDELNGSDKALAASWELPRSA